MAGTRSALEIVRKVKKLMETTDGFSRQLSDVKFISAQKGSLIGEVVLHKRHLTLGGHIHGGFLSFLVDNVTSINGTTLFENLALGSTVNIQVNYLNTAAKVGDEIRIEAGIVELQENLLIHKCTIRHKKDESIVATGNHTTFLGKFHKTYNFFNV